MTTNQQNCLSLCNFDEFCEEESGSNEETGSISSSTQDDTDGTAEESGFSNESAESSGSGSNDESSDESDYEYVSETTTYFDNLSSDSETTPSHDDGLNESIMPYDALPDEDESGNENSSDEEDYTNEPGSTTEEEHSIGSLYIWATGTEWEQSIEELSYYGEGCENGRCHGGELNSSVLFDEWLIQHEHHPYDYTVDKICWIRQNFQKNHMIVYWLTSNSDSICKFFSAMIGWNFVMQDHGMISS